MNVYGRLLFPLLRRMDAERAHDRTVRALEVAQRWPPGRVVLRKLAGEVPSRPVRAFGLTFPNVLGVAAGFDKDARVPAGLALLGFGHVEVGTLTPWPQQGNPKPRVFRLPADAAIINRMGFPNRGVVRAVQRLRTLPEIRAHVPPFVLGVSLGKQKTTPLADAVVDYLTVMKAVYPHADYLAVNVSSPNTPALRELQGRRYLDRLLGRLRVEKRTLAQRRGMAELPLLLKIAPDLTWAELDDILQAALDSGVDGLIATNTTVSRTGLAHANREEEGGLSGAPLAARSNEIIAYIHTHTAGRLPVIGVGGVRTAADVRAKLDAGATLVQAYTGLVYGGPQMPGRVLRALAQANG